MRHPRENHGIRHFRVQVEESEQEMSLSVAGKVLGSGLPIDTVGKQVRFL